MEERQREEKPPGGRDQSDTAVSHGMLTCTRIWKMQSGFPRALPGECSPANTLIAHVQIPALWETNPELPVRGALLRQPQEPSAEPLPLPVLNSGPCICSQFKCHNPSAEKSLPLLPAATEVLSGPLQLPRAGSAPRSYLCVGTAGPAWTCVQAVHGGPALWHPAHCLLHEKHFINNS